MKRLLKIALWSAIAAAFVGPGTVTTAATAGASFGAQLAWALLFSTFACFVLQEASARITITSGRTLGESLRRGRSGALGWSVLIVVSGAVILGAAAYEAGNILGGVSGLALGFDVSRSGATLVCGALAAGLLWSGAPQTVARMLALLVALMGVAFIGAALAVLPSLDFNLFALVRPKLPPDSGWLVLGLVGTTVVPYNLFLGSSLARGETLRDTRFGLLVSVLLGGAISLAVLVVGAATLAPFSFESLAAALDEQLGGGTLVLGIGLAAAGFSSAVTAPLAAALTARGLFSSGPEDPLWSRRSVRFRAVWIGVLVAGLAVGLSGIRPIAAILAAQAFNGLLLPAVAVFLLLAVNDRRLVGAAGLNRPLGNAALIVTVAVCALLGATGLAKAITGALGVERPSPQLLLWLGLAGTLLVLAPALARLPRLRQG